MTVRVADLATRPLRAIGRLATSTLGMLGVGGGIYGGVYKPLNMVIEREGIETAFEVLLGSRGAANDRIRDLDQFAKTTSFMRDEIYKSSRILQTFTGDALSTSDGLRLIGDVAAGTQHGIEETSVWFGRMYDAMRSGRPIGEATARLQEMGAISGEGRERLEALAESGEDISKTWPKAAREFEKFNGIMENIANNLEGLLLDVRTFVGDEIFLRWGQGMAKGLTASLEGFREWRSASAENIERMGEEMERLGERAAERFFNALNPIFSFAAEQFEILFPGINDQHAEMAVLMGDTGMEAEIAKIRELERTPFNARLSIVMDNTRDVFGDWWENTGQAQLNNMAEKVGQAYGGIINGVINALLGNDNESTGNAFIDAGMEAGKSFADSFIEALNPADLMNRVWDQVARANSNETSLAEGIITNVLILAAASKLLKLLGPVAGLGRGLFNAGKGAAGWAGGLFTGGKGKQKGMPRGAFQDTAGAWHRSNGQYMSKEEVAGYQSKQEARQQRKASRSYRGGAWVRTAGALGGLFSLSPSAKKTSADVGRQTRSQRHGPGVWGRVVGSTKGLFRQNAPATGFINSPQPPGGGGINRTLGRFIRPLMFGAGLMEVANAEEGERGGLLASLSGSFAGGAAGAKGGAALGALLGPKGAVAGGILGGIGGAIGGEKFADWMYNLDFTPLKEGFGNAWSWITEKWASFSSWFLDNVWNPLVDTVTNVVEWISEKWSAFSIWFTESVWEPIKNAAINTINFFVGLFDAAWLIISTVWGIASEWFVENVWNPVKEGVTLAALWVWEQLVDAWTWISETWGIVSEWFMENVWNPVIEGVTAAGIWIFERLLDAYLWIQETWNSAVEWFDETVWQPLMDALTPLALWFSEKFQEAYDWMSEVWEPVAAWFQETVWDPVESAVTTVGEAISGAFEAAWSVVEPIWSKIQDAWNAVSGWGDTIKGWGGNVVTFVQDMVGRGEDVTGWQGEYANGGIITKPHVGLVGEAGAEAIIPLSATRRSRALDLYEQTGKMLGVQPYANGGIVGGALPMAAGQASTVYASVGVNSIGTSGLDAMLRKLARNFLSL
ncbi:hypothetical protein [Geomicrobium sp. JCM 19039]|uniref:hypothetical protein n=1 Tax=Geomicrobium sp. JCM 19039 TaxID=1460636 RepID=UPI00045F46ED|nr:hypothetical protein [Geomicrobium sp. JCM 19039]GAK11402.1 phage tail length tape-measure protein [Geomicrobium sp. JCM 19039]